MTKDEYREYLGSDGWKTVSKEAKRVADGRCQICNRSENLNTHHRTYERLGRELHTDLVVLCENCHGKFHDKLPHNPVERGAIDFYASLFQTFLETGAYSATECFRIIYKYTVQPCIVCDRPVEPGLGDGSFCAMFFPKDGKGGWPYRVHKDCRETTELDAVERRLEERYGIAA